MDTKLIRQKTKQVESILEFLKDSKLSREDYDSTQEPFFKKDKKDEFIMNHKNLPKIPESLNRHIKVMYELIGDPNIEVYIGEWTILSLIKSLQNYKQYCDDGQKNVFDIGFQYMGMGHIEVLSCDLTNHLLFKRRDGGSNGWDREDNYKDLINYKTGDSEYMYFNEWKKEIIHS